MFRRLIYLVGLVSLVGLLVPAGPASAEDDLDDIASAAVTGNVLQNQGSCTPTPTPKPYDDILPSKPGELVKFTDVLMAGAFADLGALNAYTGTITVDDPIDACSSSYAVLPPPLNALSGWGRILAGGTFSGTNPIKCLEGRIGGLDATQTPDGVSAGDYIQAGTVAIVKFDIGYALGDTVGAVCVTKAEVKEINCVGTIAVAPAGSAGVGSDDPVAGAIVCHDALPSNKGKK